MRSSLQKFYGFLTVKAKDIAKDTPKSKEVKTFQESVDHRCKYLPSNETIVIIIYYVNFEVIRLFVKISLRLITSRMQRGFSIVSLM